MISALLTPAPTRVMGIVNVTPDSFSDGGDHADPGSAIAHGLRLAAEGAAIVDVGGESTRPGADRVSADEELDRVLPVVSALASQAVAVSIDTMRAEVAQCCVEAGAVIVNDVSGGLADPRMLATVARLGCGYIAMHWRTHSRQMDQAAHYQDVVAEVRAELLDRVKAAVQARIDPERIMLDPGIGFSKDPDQNWALVRAAEQFQTIGLPMLWGVSRKRFLADVSAGAQPPQRDAASAAVTAWLAGRGVWAVRTHTVTDHLAAVAVAERLRGQP